MAKTAAELMYKPNKGYLMSITLVATLGGCCLVMTQQLSQEPSAHCEPSLLNRFICQN